MAGFSNDVIYGSNIDLSGNATISATIVLDGQLIIGSTGNNPQVGTLTAGTNIGISNGAGSITINASGTAGFSWTEVTANTPITVNSGYIANKAGAACAFTLPVTAAVGTIARICGKGATGWSIVQAAGQNVQMGSSSTTAGAGTKVVTTNQFDGIELVCTVADTTWTAISMMGNLTIS